MGGVGKDEVRLATASGPEPECPVAALPIGVLHLGVKTATLRAAGLRTVGDVRDADPDAVARIPTVGWRTVDQLVRNRKALAAAGGPAVPTDWAGYCEAIGVALLPDGHPPETGEEFLSALAPFFDQVAARLDDVILAVILRGRICQPPGRQLTLDAIAGQSSPSLSRERIRQKEKKLLGQLTGGLLNDSYEGLGIHFHPGFTRWWRMAADALAGLDDIEVEAFVALLSDVWNVPEVAVMAQLPAILAIVTGEPQMSGGFRSATRINPRLFGAIGEEFRKLPVRRLRFGKYADALEAAGLPFLGDVITRLRADSLSVAGATAARHVTQHLDLVADCLSEVGEVDWSAYRRRAGLARVPASPPLGAAGFASGLRETAVTLLRLHPVSKRAAAIFSRRTSRDAGSRMTLQQVADELMTHLPTVKREENVLLRWLHDAVIGHDFSALDVWLDEAWLDYWSQASEQYGAADDYEGFAGNLAWRWRLTGRETRQAAPLLWAVLDGYPDGRRSGYRPPSPPIHAAPAGRIHLRGFRRLH